MSSEVVSAGGPKGVEGGRMSSIAMEMFDKAKKKAAKEGVKRSSVRLDEEDASDGLPFGPPPESQISQRLPMLKLVGSVLTTLILAAVCSAVLRAGTNSTPARVHSPTLAPSASSPAPATSSGTGGNPAVISSDGGGISSGEPAPSIVQAPLKDEIDPANIQAHLESLHAIAMSNGGNRAMGNSGYNESVQYVLSKLSTLSGLKVTTQDFSVSKNQIDAAVPATLSVSSMPSLAKDVDFATMANTGFGNITGVLIPAGFNSDGAEKGKSIGCNANGSSDFGAVSAAAESGLNVIALVERGSCFFFDKMNNARAAGAKAVVIYNSNGGGVFSGTLGSTGDVSAYPPALGLSAALGAQVLEIYYKCPWPSFSKSHTLLRGPAGQRQQDTTPCAAMEAAVMISGTFSSITSQNIIAETVTGDDTSVIVVGAHLDGVEAGPGINDNGSGSSTMLEIVRAFTSLAFPGGSGGGLRTAAPGAVGFSVGSRGIRGREGGMTEAKGVKQVLNVSNRVRFCWWGGEESGLLGSRAYVAMLNRTGQLYRVALNLNFDMLGSPNFKTGVYNGTDAEKQDAAAVFGSSYIMKIFTKFFSTLSPQQPWTPSAFTGRSDYGPFLEMGIPAGGLDTGAEGIKSMGDRKVFGGLAKTAFDPCYHQECDDILNVNMGEIGLLSRAVAHALEHLVTDHELRHTLKYPLERSSSSSRRHTHSSHHPAAVSVPLSKGVALPYAGPHALF